jgi:TPR repeat protein
MWMGDLHYRGLLCIPRDFSKSAEWFSKVADNQDQLRQHCPLRAIKIREAAYAHGYLYLHGQGVTKDRDKARLYFSRAFEFGEEKAQKALRYLPPLKWTDRLIRLEPPGRKWKGYPETW